MVAALPHLRTIDDYRGAARRHPALVGALVVCLLGLIGTPPTAVFVGKLTVFTAASVFYYLRWIAPAFRPAGTGPAAAQHLVDDWPAAAACVAAAAAVLGGVLAGVLLPLVSAGPIGGS